MEQSKLRKLQLVQLDILDHVADVCDSNGITYYLSDGALLGAVREGRFIPWDDDIDVSMPYTDYLRFLEIGQAALGDAYFLQTSKTDPCWNNGFARVRLNNTTMIFGGNRHWHAHGGIYIDIFPIIFVGGRVDYKIKKIAYSFSNFFLIDSFFRAQKETFYKDFGTIKCKIMELFFHLPYSVRYKLHEFVVHSVMKGKKKWKCSEVWKTLGGPYPISLIDGTQEIEFEGRQYKTYGDYTAFLETAYGKDWKTPRYAEKGHDKLIVDFDNDYTTYFL